MPVHYFLDDRHLLEKGLRNYWGYNTLGFFAPSRLCLEPSRPMEAVKRVQADGQGSSTTPASR
jgi:isoamylase